MDYIVYILHSDKLNRYYIGATSNIDVRMDFHENAENHKYTHNANDWQLYLQLTAIINPKCWL